MRAISREKERDRERCLNDLMSVSLRHDSNDRLSVQPADTISFSSQTSCWAAGARLSGEEVVGQELKVYRMMNLSLFLSLSSLDPPLSLSQYTFLPLISGITDCALINGLP